jgi:sugar phosphate isomerase/epimerase
MKPPYLSILVLLLASIAAPVLADPPKTARLPNAFYAMDTCTKRPYPRNDIPPAAQLDMLKELGYAGIAWTEEEPQEVRAAAVLAEQRGLKMFAIYCGASVSPKGLTVSPRLKAIIQALKGHDTIIWLHIGGQGPETATLQGEEPVVRDLRTLADFAAEQGLKVAVYPHVGEWTDHVQEAMELAKAVQRKNFGITFNLCHCLALGDEQRIPQLLEQAAPYLFTVTINGADADVNGANWKRLIQPLGQGNFPVAALLRKLQQVQFRGPIGLQGYGLGGDRRTNLETSVRAWHQLSRAVAGAESKGQTDGK